MTTGDKGKIVSRQQSEDRFRLFFDGAADALFLHDLDGRFVEVNQAACDSLGYTREELLQRHVLDIEVGITPGALTQVRAMILRGEKFTVEGLNRRKDGTTFPVEVHLGPFEYAGRPHILASTRDISKRRRAEEALHTSESFLNSIIDQSPYPMWISDGQGTLIRLNQTCQDLLHITAAEVVGKYNIFQDNIVEEQGFFPLLQRVFEKGETVRFELAYDASRLKTPQLRSAKSVIVDVTVSPIIDKKGRITNAVFQHVDITARKRAEEALKKEKLFTEAILDSLPGTFFLFDSQAKHLRTNTSGQVFSGYSFEDLPNMHALDFIAEEDRPAVQRAIEEILDKGESSVEAQQLSKDGRKTPFLFTAKKFIIDDLPYILGTGMDITQIKQTEEALRESERKYRSLYQEFQGILDAIPDSLSLLSPDLKIVWANWIAAADMDMEMSDFMGQLCYQARHGRSAPCEVCAVQECFASGKPTIGESTTPDGRIWELRAFPLFGDRGEVKGVIELARGITERKQMEEALRESEARFRQVVESSPLPMGIGADDGMIEYVNPKFVETFGYTLEEIPKLEDWFRLAYPDPAYRQGLILRWQEAMESMARENGASEVAEVEITCNDGSRRIMEIFATLMGNKSLVVFRDLTERKRVEEALRESEARFRQVVESSPLPIGIAADRGMIEYVNPKFVETFGYTLEDIPQLEDWYRQAYPDPLYRQKNIEYWQTAMEQAVRESRPTEIIEVEVTCKDASKKIVDIFGTLIGKKTLGVFNDVTERKRAEEEQARLEAQMREVQKLESLGVLAGGIAHDFNNLLMAILGNADLALLALSPASPARPNVEEIARASQRAADLCRQMLAYSGKGRFMVGRYDLSEIVQEMAQMLQVTVSKKAALRYSFAADLPAVEADATQMRQVIMNLITNASESLGDESGVVSVTTGIMECDRAYLSESHLDDRLPEGRYVYLEVADTGYGMDDETRRRIFDPFFTTKFTGRGLGLSAVLGIVRGHQGAIKVRSEPGKGTTFTILLPAVEWEPGDRVLTGTLVLPPRRQGTILLVDDDPRVRSVAGEMLKRLGFKILTAAQGQEGLEVFRARGSEIDCVLLDLTMPGMGGEEAFQELRRLQPDVRVILSSGYDEQDATKQFVGQGLGGFIQKPYTLAKLQEVLNRVLRQ